MNISCFTSKAMLSASHVLLNARSTASSQPSRGRVHTHRACPPTSPSAPARSHRSRSSKWRFEALMLVARSPSSRSEESSSSPMGLVGEMWCPAAASSCSSSSTSSSSARLSTAALSGPLASWLMYPMARRSVSAASAAASRRRAASSLWPSRITAPLTNTARTDAAATCPNMNMRLPTTMARSLAEDAFRPAGHTLPAGGPVTGEPSRPPPPVASHAGHSTSGEWTSRLGRMMAAGKTTMCIRFTQQWGLLRAQQRPWRGLCSCMPSPESPALLLAAGVPALGRMGRRILDLVLQQLLARLTQHAPAQLRPDGPAKPSAAHSSGQMGPSTS
mmetsp:Transcript_4602/g.19588  ORF Transcript_4602/g.19588 Transcript_4602/m.19588 type:complete len:332 (+) Transcript_4602:965-1960(+)